MRRSSNPAYEKLIAEMAEAGRRFNSSLLSHFYYACFTGIVDSVMREYNKNPNVDVNKKELELQINSLTCVAIGSLTERVGGDPKVVSDYVAVAKFLVSKGAKINFLDKYNFIPLKLCAHSDNLDLAKFFLENGADPNIQDKAGCTCLHDAVLAGNEPLCKLLLQHGADPSIKDGEGVTPVEQSLHFPKLNKLLADTVKKNRGEEVITKADLKKCVACQKPGEKRCGACQSVFYCSKECQVADWKEHKKVCKKPDYISVKTGIAPWGPGDTFLGTIPTKDIYNATVNGKAIPKSVQKKPPADMQKLIASKELEKTFTIKIQIPAFGNPLGSDSASMVYNKSRKFQALISRDNCTRYEELVKLIQTKGVMGLKGYFNVMMCEDGEMRVFVDKLLPQQDW